MRARLALIVSGQRCELREVVLRDKPAALIAASHKATVPVLVLADGTVIEQSLDIMRWALRRSDPMGWLREDDGTEWIARCDGEFKTQLDRYKYPSRYDDAPGAARERGAAFLRELESRLAASPHLCGTHATLADAALFPFVRQFSMVEPAWFGAQPWPRLNAWLAAWIAGDLFARAMHKYAAWKPGEPRVEFPPA